MADSSAAFAKLLWQPALLLLSIDNKETKEGPIDNSPSNAVVTQTVPENNAAEKRADSKEPPSPCIAPPRPPGNNKISQTEGNKDPFRDLVARDVSTYENQRYYLRSWSRNLLPTDRLNRFVKASGLRRALCLTIEMRFSKANLERCRWDGGAPERELQAAAGAENLFVTGCDKGWKWDGGWRISAGDKTDVLGWIYAVDFGWTWYPSLMRKTFVRRRKWIRTMKRDLKDASLASSANDSSTEAVKSIRFQPGKLGFRFSSHNEVTGVAPNSQALAKGVREGWVISHVNGRREYLKIEGDLDITFNTTGAHLILVILASSVAQLSKEEHLLVGDFFECLDLDGNGHIDAKEAKAKLHNEAHFVFEDVEVDGDGSVSRNKFIEAFVRYKNRLGTKQSGSADKISTAKKDTSRKEGGAVGSKNGENDDRKQGGGDAQVQEEAEPSPVSLSNPVLVADLKSCIHHAKEATRSSRMLLEQKMYGVAELVDDDDSEEEDGEDGAPR
eukprot:jgi/Bigna1/82209/fgenesh1_pg.89_\